MKRAEVVVIGAGPAGAGVALNLAPMRQVILLDRQLSAPQRIGESLSPAARRLLVDMGLFESFRLQGHAACYGNRAVWGSDEPFETDFMRDPNGHGWHLDRARFEAWLRAAAVARGAELIAPAQVQAMDWRDGAWLLSLCTPPGRIEIEAEFLIDASGRGASLTRRYSRRKTDDRLVCGWVYGHLRSPDREAGLTYVEASENGWWYTAPLPGGRRILAFHTDADLPAAGIAQDANALIRSADGQAGLARLLSSCGFTRGETRGFTTACGSVALPSVGPGWLAVGDAALTFDPLAAQGLFNALFTGLAAAEATDRHLHGDPGGLSDYVHTIAQIRDVYRRELAFWYGQERRWPEHPFWRRRHRTSHPENRDLSGTGSRSSFPYVPPTA